MPYHEPGRVRWLPGLRCQSSATHCENPHADCHLQPDRIQATQLHVLLDPGGPWVQALTQSQNNG